MLRVRIFAFAVACMMVAPAADAQGNRGNSNGVPGSIASVQAVVNAVLAQIATLPNFAALQAQLTALQADVLALKAGASELTGSVDGLRTRLNALEARLDAAMAAVDGRLAGLEGQAGEFSNTLGEISGVVSDLTNRVVALEGAGGGGDASPVIWSGGCSTPGSGGVGTFARYCTNRTDFENSASHLNVDPSGVVTVLTPGIYRLAYWGVNVGATGSVRVLVNGLVISSGVNTAGQAGAGTQRDQYADVTWPMNAGDLFEIQVLVGASGTNAYLAWAAPTAPGGVAAGSRLQVSYVGP